MFNYATIALTHLLPGQVRSSSSFSSFLSSLSLAYFLHKKTVKYCTRRDASFNFLAFFISTRGNCKREACTRDDKFNDDDDDDDGTIISV